MKLKIATLVFFATALNTLYAQSFIQAYADVVNQTSQTNINSHLEDFESLGVKRRGTQALQNTLNWLKSEYLSYGYTSSQLTEDTFQNGFYSCKNLIVTKTGTVYPNTFVIICGHYDSLTGTGTNDNGSGVATILEVARLLQSIPTEYSIKFINFSGEEDGLRGSEHYVQNVVNGMSPKLNIRLVLNIDQVGGVAGETNDTLTCERDLGSPSSNNAASYQRTLELATCVELYSPLNTIITEAYGSDYIPFQDNNEIITGLYETNESQQPHSEYDLLSNMDPVYNYNVAKAAVGAMMHFAIASTSILDINQYNQNQQVSFYPNPATNQININFGNVSSTENLFTLTDINGRIVLTKKLTNTNPIETIQLNNLAKGVYLINLISGTNTIRKKIVIQ